MRGAPAEDSGFFSIWPARKAVFRPFRPISNIPEDRVVNAGAAVFTRLDPFMARHHARRVRQVLGQNYAAIRAESPEFMALPGVSDLALNHLCGLHHDTGHYYAYIPAESVVMKPGLLVFLHGNAGNLKLFCHRWKNLANSLGLAVLAPTNGFGFWGRNSAKVVQSAIIDALGRWPKIDPGHGQWLVGLSDGGNGLTRAANACPWHGLVYLSATMRAKELAAHDFIHQWKNRPVLVMHGRADHNVSPRMVHKSIEVLQAGAVDVSAEWYDGEDHFLTLGAADAVDSRIASWIRAVGPDHIARPAASS